MRSNLCAKHRCTCVSVRYLYSPELTEKSVDWPIYQSRKINRTTILVHLTKPIHSESLHIAFLLTVSSFRPFPAKCVHFNGIDSIFPQNFLEISFRDLESFLGDFFSVEKSLVIRILKCSRTMVILQIVKILLYLQSSS